MSRKYKDAAAKLQQNVQKHLKEMKEVLSSDDEEPYESSVLEGVLQSYRHGGGDAHMLQRTKNLLEETLSGRPVICLICIGSVKRLDAIWSCEHCYSYFHLSCIQKWSNDSISLRSEENNGPISVFVAKKIEWCCPKCRHAYSKEQIPQKYQCYCGKTLDPPFHPWLIPHSCGEVCEKRLSTGENCKHRCLLLCHPGPCPPCPQMVNGACFCQKEHKKVRCSGSKWSCGQQCQKILSCKSHKCESLCHEGDCSLCRYTSIQPCQCKAEKVNRPCSDPFWQCQKVCNKPYSCGFHNCEKVCHPGDCNLCPNSGMCSCPCGKVQRYVECPDVMETCVETCGKKREDCFHSCPEKCHKGPCPPCLVLVEKKCQCNMHSKSLPCSREYRCETKCRGVRACGKHGCSRKCCNGNCPPCEKVCDKPLQCKRHKCTTICHRGPCYPCPRESQVTCRCKETSITVPCGRERQTKPPRCRLPCKIKYKCGHVDENVHQCHFGDCPPCKAICDKIHACGHKCPAVCHQNVAVTFKQVEKPATPWEVQPPKTKMMALDCPPCTTLVPVTCFGEHETVNQACHVAIRFSCGRGCGRPLPCGNHNCAALCHLFKHDAEFPAVPCTCEPCEEECLKPRPEKCTHKCPKQVCHPGECPQCEIIKRTPCHCGLNELYLRCSELSSATEQMLSCNQQCPRNMPCGHRCKEICHSNECIAQVCTKKAKAYCPCGNLKKELPCNLIKDGKKLDCDETCEAKKLAAQLEKEKEEQRRRELEEEKNKRELAEYEWKMSGKKRRHKEKRVVENKDERGFLKKFWVPITAVFTVIIGGAYFIIVDY